MPASQQHDAAVCIGRFQPFHLGHLRRLEQALALAPRCVVVIGSAFQARTPRHPWLWQERAEMIRLAVPAGDRARLSFLPLRDYHDDARWIEALQRGVASLSRQEPATVAVLGPMDGAARARWPGATGWHTIATERSGTVEARHLRDALFAAAPMGIDAALAAMVELAPPSTLAFLQDWVAQPCLPRLAEDWRAMWRYHAGWAGTPRQPVLVTVDALLRCAGHVLLIRRGEAPGKGLLALPGGFIDQRETLYQSAVRELREETGLVLPEATLRDSLRGVAVFDDPQRGQRGRILSHVHCFDLGSQGLPEVQAGDDAEAASWLPIDRLASLEDQFHDDHFHMLDHFLGITPPPGGCTA